jgi:hypothetical protein
LTHSVWNWKREGEEPYLIPLPREKSPASEVENPEEAVLDFDDGIDIDWDDDEVDAALMDDEDSDVDVPSDDEADVPDVDVPNGTILTDTAWSNGDSEAAESDYGSSIAGIGEEEADSEAVESDYGSSQNGDNNIGDEDDDDEVFSAGEEDDNVIQNNQIRDYNETDDDDMAGLIEDALDDIESDSEADYGSSQVPEDEADADADMINTLKRRLVEEHDDEDLQRPPKRR